MKNNILILVIISLLLLIGCKDDNPQKVSPPESENDKTFTTVGYGEEEEKTEFCLISESVIIQLNTDLSQLHMEPISVENGSGDGFKWTDNKYEDVEIKALISDDNKSIINKISTESSAYETTGGIKVGDSVVKLKDVYEEDLIYSESIERNYYLYDPDNDIGFNKIYFYCTNDTITRIVIENGIDG